MLSVVVAFPSVLTRGGSAALGGTNRCRPCLGCVGGCWVLSPGPLPGPRSGACKCPARGQEAPGRRELINGGSFRGGGFSCPAASPSAPDRSTSKGAAWTCSPSSLPASGRGSSSCGFTNGLPSDPRSKTTWRPGFHGAVGSSSLFSSACRGSMARGWSSPPPDFSSPASEQLEFVAYSSVKEESFSLITAPTLT